MNAPHLVALAIIIFGLGIALAGALACDGTAAPIPTPIVMVVTATPEATLPPTSTPTPEPTATPTPKPTATPTSTPEPTATPLPTPTPTPTLTPVPTATPTPTPTPEPTATPTPAPTSTPTREPPLPSGAKRQALHQELSDSFNLMMEVWDACGDPQFDGKRRLSDLGASLEAMKIIDEVVAEMEEYGHTDDYTEADFRGLTRAIDRAVLELWDTCVPPDFEPQK